MPWDLTTFVVRRLTSAPAAATGQCQVALTQVPTTQCWRVEQIAVQCTSGADTVLYVYDQDPVAKPVPCQGTRYGNFTVDDQASPITLLPGSQLFIEWEGASSGAVGRARVQYTVLRGTNRGTPVPYSG